MSEENLRYVIDASVAIKLFVEEQYSDIVHALFENLQKNTGTGFFVPDLFYIECTNVLLKYVSRFGRSLEDSLADVADLNRLALKSVPTTILIEESLVLADEKKLTAYDACYAVLARRLQVPLITADRKVAETVDWAVWLGDFQIDASR